MRRVLVLGGTGWLGGAVVRAALAEDAEVVCLARGESGAVPEGARLVAADRRAADAYHGVAGPWDEVIEVAYQPDLVGPALDALAARASHWTLVSTISVYLRNDEPGADESAELVEPDDLTAYPDAKVAAERATTAAVGDRLLIVRPGLIAGPGDPSDRFGYWPARLHRGGRVLVPPTTGRYVQVIDVDDLAGFIVAAGREGATGVVNAVGEPVPLASFLAEAVELAGFTGELATADDDWLLEHDVNYWAGPRSLPLWIPAEDAALLQRSNAAYRAAGGIVRPLQETIARSLADELARGVTRARRSGLSAEDEHELLARLG